MRSHFAAALAAFALALTGCGPTIGDPCTTVQECGTGAACINRDFAPGGYCSLACTLGAANSCPGGTTCVRDALGKNTPGCMRVCKEVRECRSGYQCQFAKDSTATVCIGPSGI